LIIFQDGIPDFSNWKHPAAFARAFVRLEKDLRIRLCFASARQASLR
jgi:hypothetical protein